MDPMFGVHWRLLVTPLLVQMEYLQKEYFPFKTVIIDDSLQITLGKKLPSVIWNFLISLFVQLPVLFSTSWSQLIFFINIPFEQGENVTKRCQMNPKHWIHSQNGLTLCSNIQIFASKNNQWFSDSIIPVKKSLHKCTQCKLLKFSVSELMIPSCPNLGKKN